MAGSKVGTPYVNGASVEAKVEKHGKQKKLLSLSIYQRKVLIRNKVIVNHILSLQSQKLTLN